MGESCQKLEFPVWGWDWTNADICRWIPVHCGMLAVDEKGGGGRGLEVAHTNQTLPILNPRPS